MKPIIGVVPEINEEEGLYFIVSRQKTPTSRNVKGEAPVSKREMNIVRREREFDFSDKCH